ncbi:hypothetical protein INR49_001871 [Caranx melampygus]|nr:hypothetical protein INR49_001871 [Caranx melampygus]
MFSSDLSENAIQAIPRRAFRGATDLKNLQLDKTTSAASRRGVQGPALSGSAVSLILLSSHQSVVLGIQTILQITVSSPSFPLPLCLCLSLSLSPPPPPPPPPPPNTEQHNISSIPVSSFNHMPKLRTFRLHSNSLRCDCHLAWLSPWLRQRPALGLYTQCSSPPTLRASTSPSCARATSPAQVHHHQHHHHHRQQQQLINE